MRSSEEALAKGAFLCCDGASAVMTLSVFLFMIALGLPLFRGGAFSVWTGQWSPHAGLSGIGLMISGTLWIALLATALFIYCLPKYKPIYLADLKKMLDNLSDST